MLLSVMNSTKGRLANARRQLARARMADFKVEITAWSFASIAHSRAARLMSTFRLCQSFFRKALLLFRFPSKWHHFVRYLATKLLVGNGVARIPQRGRIRSARFPIPAVYGLLPNRGEQNLMRNRLAYAHDVFDVGANVGVWTVLMSKLNPSARIHSFEPNSATFNLLEVNVKENSCGNVALINAAASDQEGTVLLRSTDERIDLRSYCSHRTADRFRTIAF